MRRNRTKVVWLPQDNINSIGAAGSNVFQRFALNAVGVTGDFAVGEIPLTIDNPPGATTAGTTLSDIYSSGYRLRRIVGKVWVDQQQLAEDTANDFIVTVGIIVRRVDPAAGTSLALLTGVGETLSPQEIENSADPWIWRRSWRLNNLLATPQDPIGNQSEESLLENNYGYGPSAVDGPHIDQKTARIIGPEERLFLTASSMIADGSMFALSSTTFITTDLRVLGSMRTMVGNRRNASR